MTRSEFREKWGNPWAALIASPMWRDAIAAADAEIRVFQVAGLTDEQIEQHGHLALKGMQAHCKLELTLATLAEKPFEFAQLEQTHPDPIAEADAEAKRLAGLTQPTKPRRKKKP